MFRIKSLEHPTVSHGFFTRRGGISAGAFASLNFAYNKGDPESNIQANKLVVAEKLSMVRRKVILLNQVHGNDIITINENDDVAGTSADGMATKRKDIILGIMGADCPSVLFTDPTNGVIAAVHSGWRGTAKNIVKNAILAMESLGSNPNNIHAGIGPSISQEHYEVGREFKDIFPQRFLKKSPNENHFLLDISGVILAQLSELGLNSIEICGQDTYSQPDLFFSCRRATHNKEDTYGCQLAAIGLR